MTIRPYRWGVLQAAAWRVVAEIYRRHAHQHALRISHLHPGLSGWGILRIHDGWPGTDTPRIDLCLGGGENGRVRVSPWAPVDAPMVATWTDDNFVRELLSDRDPKVVIDDIGQSAGLASGDSIPASTAGVVAVRVIAEVLERHALARTPLRASCGFQDSSGPNVTAWARTAPTVPEVRGGVWLSHEGVDIANRIWALHKAVPHDGPAGDELPDGAVVLDIVAGEAWSARRPGERINLLGRYNEHGRRVDLLTDDVVRLMRAL